MNNKRRGRRVCGVDFSLSLSLLLSLSSLSRLCVCVCVFTVCTKLTSYHNKLYVDTYSIHGHISTMILFH